MFLTYSVVVYYRGQGRIQHSLWSVGTPPRKSVKSEIAVFFCSRKIRVSHLFYYININLKSFYSVSDVTALLGYRIVGVLNAHSTHNGGSVLNRT